MQTLRHTRGIPGFSISLGITMGWLGFIFIIPVVALVLRATSLGSETLLSIITRPAALYSLKITMGYACAAAICSTIIGTCIAWSFTRYRFPFSRFFDALIDLPFALPGAVGGIALASVFGSNGWIGKQFDAVGIQLIYNQFGIFIGLLFVMLPFAVRSVQALIQELDEREIQAARLLGASNVQIFFRILFPQLVPGIYSGFITSFARGIGEYGTVIFVAGNIPYQSEVLSRYIYNKIDQYDVTGATVVAAALLLISFALLSLLNISKRYVYGGAHESYR